MEDESYWHDQAYKAKNKSSAILAFGVYTGIKLSREKELCEALRALVSAARTSGGAAGCDEHLSAACDAAELLLQ